MFYPTAAGYPLRPLNEKCLSVIVSTLLQHESLEPDQLWDKLPHYVPPRDKKYIICEFKALMYLLSAPPSDYFGEVPQDEAEEKMTSASESSVTVQMITLTEDSDGEGSFDQNHRSGFQSGLFSMSQYKSEGIPAAHYLEAQAEEIMDKLDKEEPLLPSEFSNAPPTTPTTAPPMGQLSSVPNMLLPESPPFENLDFFSSDKSLSLVSSYENGLNKQISRGTEEPNSLAVEGKVETEYPEQQITHEFRVVS